MGGFSLLSTASALGFSGSLFGLLLAFCSDELTSQLFTRSGITSVDGTRALVGGGGLCDADRLSKRLLRFGGGDFVRERFRLSLSRPSDSFFSLARVSRIASSWAFSVSRSLSCSACLSLISSFFCSRNLAGMPPIFSCALSSSSHNSSMNALAFFAFRNPVKFICICLPSGFFSSS